MFDFPPSVAHLTLLPLFFITQKWLSHSTMHVESENQNTKGTIETKNILYFCFWIKWCWGANSMKKTCSMGKGSSDLSKSQFGCHFCRSLVNFKNLIILFWNLWVMYGSWKSWRSVVFDSKHKKQFVIGDPKSLYKIPGLFNLVWKKPNQKKWKVICHAYTAAKFVLVHFIGWPSLSVFLIPICWSYPS